MLKRLEDSNKLNNKPLEPVVAYEGRTLGMGLVWGLALCFVAIAVLVLYLPNEFARPLTMGFLGLLAIIGVFFCFAFASGFLNFGTQRRNNDFAQAFIDGMSEGVVVTDKGCKIRYANQAYFQMTHENNTQNAGINKGQLIDDKVTETTDALASDIGYDVQTLEQFFANDMVIANRIYGLEQKALKLSGNQTVYDEFCVQKGFSEDEAYSPFTKAAQKCWYAVSARAMQFDPKEPLLIVWQVRDVSEKRRHQELAFQNLQYAIDYLDHAPAGFIACDNMNNIAYMNATLADWLGIDLAQFQPYQMSIETLIVGENASRLNAVKAEADEEKIVVVDLDLEKTNGQILPVRLLHKIIFDHMGQRKSSQTLVLNRMKGAENDIALRLAEIRFTRFFNNTPIAISSLSASGAIVNTNAAFMNLFGRGGEINELHMGASLFDYVDEKHHERLYSALKAAQNGQSTIPPIDTTLAKDDGVAIRFYISSMGNDEGEQLEEGAGQSQNSDGECAILYAVDMSEQRALEAQFAESQKMQAIGEFAGGAAHDFNNLLTAIIGNVDLLLEKNSASDPSFIELKNIKQNANRAANLVRQLLAYSRRQTLRPTELILPDVFVNFDDLLRRSIKGNVAVATHFDRNLWAIKADLNQFEQVMLNLGINAGDAMLETGRKSGNSFTIECKNLANEDIHNWYKAQSFKHTPMALRKDEVNDFVLLEVNDNGPGMPLEVMQKIFDPFYTTKDVGKGTGLGLATVMGIVSQSGGYIFPKSEAGEGTSFMVLFPRFVASENEQVEVTKVEEKPRDLTGNAKILLVEDEDGVRAFALRALENRGYEVFEAESGIEALEIMEEHGDDIDLVVSDVVMPEMDGPALFAKLREKRKDLKFIFVSGYAETAFDNGLPEEDRDKFTFLPKPYTLKQLATMVTDTLNG
jgi:two-component system cell cycle sensor histidine kinase/response regulator CckA